jgi:hypothetical protein
MMGSPITPTFPMPTYDTVKPGALQMLPGAGGVGHLTAAEFAVANGLIAEDPGAPIVVVGSDGHARLLSDLGEDATVPEGGLWLCARGTCECPEGASGQTPATRPWAFPSALALRGPAGATVESIRLEDYCAPPEQPPPGAENPLDCSGGGCGSSNGDPHLVTLDGKPYDFQAVGEFTLVKSRSGDLEVQARQQPARTLGAISNNTLSLNTALAMRVAGSRVGVYAAKKGMRVRVNGRQVKTPTDGESVSLPGGGALAERADQLAVIWSDGSEARVWSVGSYGVAIMILPAPSRAGDLVGLLGNFDGNEANDFATRAGKSIPAGALLGTGTRAFNLLYRKFGESWRISQRQSLFDYGRGKSTRSYTRRAFPSRRLGVGSLPPALRRRAERICRAAGVRGRAALENCILDVAATGEAAFARDAATLEATAGRGAGSAVLEGPVLGDPNGVVSMEVVIRDGNPDEIRNLAYENLDAYCRQDDGSQLLVGEISGNAGTNLDSPGIYGENVSWLSYPQNPARQVQMFGTVNEQGTEVSAELRVYNNESCGNATATFTASR